VLPDLRRSLVEVLLLRKAAELFDEVGAELVLVAVKARIVGAGAGVLAVRFQEDVAALVDECALYVLFGPPGAARG